ncbi:unnamed protein product, partial [Nesidiocoris tenuis]
PDRYIDGMPEERGKFRPNRRGKRGKSPGRAGGPGPRRLFNSSPSSSHPPPPQPLRYVHRRAARSAPPVV